VKDLDETRAAALGRKAPKPPKAGQLVEQCVQMGDRLGLLRRRGDLLCSTPYGMTLTAGDEPDNLQELFKLFWKTFPYFRQLIKAVCGQPAGFLLPVNRYGGRFNDSAREQGLQFDQMSFEVIRDLATDFRVLNWRPIFMQDGQYQEVYPVGTATELPRGAEKPPATDASLDLQPEPGTAYIPPNYLLELPLGRAWVFVGNTMALKSFEQALWTHYLQLTDRVPRAPVLYPELRDVVCRVLQLPDEHFNVSVMALIRRPRRLQIYPAAGVLDYSSKAAIAYKQVPPRTPAGHFMTYLKIDRRTPQHAA
jgi:hypothetical protein